VVNKPYLISDIRFLVVITLVTSLLVTSLTFLSFARIQEDMLSTDVQLISDITDMLAQPLATSSLNTNSLVLSLESIYINRPSIAYCLLTQSTGQTLAVLPEPLLGYNTIVTAVMKPEKVDTNNQKVYVARSIFHTKQVFDISISFFDINQHRYLLALGIYCRPSMTMRPLLMRSVSITVFVSIWFTSILSIFINNLSVYRFVDTLRKGIQSIASGDFNKRIISNDKNRFSNLLLDFNEMAKRLDIYDKNNVQQLILEKSKLETLVSVIADGAILLDKDLRIVFINQSAAKTFKFLRSCIRGTHIYTYFPDFINRQLLPILNQILQTSPLGQDLRGHSTFSVHVDDNHSKTFQFVVTHTIDHERQTFTGIAIIIQDITTQVDLNEAKNQFISNVSHELRTPLFNIRSFLETLSEYQDSLTSKQQKEFLEIANQETLRLTNLVNDVLDLSRLESGFIDQLERVEVFDIIPSTIQASNLRACQQNIELSFKICPIVSSIDGYPNLIIQVISNLIGNSLKFTKSDGKIIVKAYPLESYNQMNYIFPGKIRIEIIDDGAGIGKLDQDRIFDRFVRLENNVHTLNGTGLGLSIVKNIIEKHDSQIFLYSEIGIGSSFWFDLHVAENKN